VPGCSGLGEENIRRNSAVLENIALHTDVILYALPVDTGRATGLPTAIEKYLKSLNRYYASSPSHLFMVDTSLVC